MIRRLPVYSISLVLLPLAACQEQPAGEPVVRTSLDGSDPVEEPEMVDAQAAPTPNPSETPQVAVSACEDVTFEQAELIHCIADPAKHLIKTALRPDGGQPYGSLTAYAATVDGSKVAFAMNAGAFGDDLRAIGYFVEDGKRLKLLNREDGDGNFFLKPNGVFYGTGGEWRMRTTDSFLRNVSDRPNFGTQSGPMLVINGELHPEIQKDGPSRAIRNGVGLSSDGKAHFVIANSPVSFGKFARFFKDQLKTPNALMLDANVSGLWDPASGRLDSKRAGPIIVVTMK